MMVNRKISACPKQPTKLKIDLDKVLEEIGLGKYQLKLAPCALVAFFTGYSILNYLFVAARIKTRCLIPECESKNEPEFSPSWIANAVPTFEQTFDECHRFAPSAASLNAVPSSCPADLFENSSIIKCTEYIYEHKNSAVYEFDLACDEWRWFVIGSSLVVGMTISLPLSGFVADRWGRRVGLTLNIFSLGLCNTLTYFSNSYTTFLLGGFLGSVLGSSGLTCAIILALEYVTPKHRRWASCILMMCSSFGASIQGVVAWTEPYWRDLILMIYAPMLVSFSFFWIAPESVRWLISKGRHEEAKTLLIKAAETNDSTLSTETLKSFSNVDPDVKEEAQNDTNIILLIFKHKEILLRCMITPIWWITSVFVTQGMKIHAVGISGNKAINFTAISAIHAPSYLVTTFLMSKVGKRKLLIVGFWACAACQVGCIFIPKDHYIALLSVYLLAKFSIAVTMLIIYTYTPELFPTECRTRLTTFSSMIGRVGAFIAPLVPALVSGVWEYLPNVLFSGLAFISGVLTLLVPETTDTSLPDSMDEAANLGKQQPTNQNKNLKEITRL